MAKRPFNGYYAGGGDMKWIRFEMRMSTARLALVCSVMGMLACAINPVTGRRELSLMSAARELELGRQSDPQIVAAYGLYDNAELAAYVDAVGQKLVKVSHRPDLKFTFRVLDSPVINAFALPGGFVYLTRGILAHMNNEAELAVVMGHEIGHVTARHSAKQYSRQTVAGLGLGLGSILVPRVAEFGQLAQSALGVMFLKHGRDAEHQADQLGVAYSLKAGYDPKRGAKFFEVLDRQQQESGGSLPGWLSTHPAPKDRVLRTTRLAEPQMAATKGPFRVGEGSLKAELDHIVFGEDPRQGFVEGQTFMHPDLEFKLTFPEGWSIQNTPTAVFAVAPKQQAQLKLTLEPDGGLTPREFAEQLARKANATFRSRSARRIHGNAAYFAVLSVPGEGRRSLVQIVCIRRSGSESIYLLVGAVANGFDRWQPRFLESARSFAALTDAKALNIQPNLLRIRAVKPEGSLSKVYAGLPEMPVPISKIALLNNIRAETDLRLGFQLKIVEGNYIKSQ